MYAANSEKTANRRATKATPEKGRKGGYGSLDRTGLHRVAEVHRGPGFQVQETGEKPAMPSPLALGYARGSSPSTAYARCLTLRLSPGLARLCASARSFATTSTYMRVTTAEAGRRGSTRGASAAHCAG